MTKKGSVEKRLDGATMNNDGTTTRK